MLVPKTFQFVPESLPETGEWEKQQEIAALTLLRQAIDLFLRAEKWQPAEGDNDPDLLVLIPRSNEQVTVSDVRWLSKNAGRHKARVLVCDAYDHFAPLPEGAVPRLLILHQHIMLDSCHKAL